VTYVSEKKILEVADIGKGALITKQARVREKSGELVALITYSLFYRGIG